MIKIMAWAWALYFLWAALLYVYDLVMTLVDDAHLLM